MYLSGLGEDDLDLDDLKTFRIKPKEEKVSERLKIPEIKPGELNLEQFKLEDSSKKDEEFSYDVNEIVRTYEIFDSPPLSDSDEMKRKEFERRVTESVSPSVPWTPDHDQKVDFIGKIDLLLPKKEDERAEDKIKLISKIISYCHLKQVISSLFLVCQSFYDASLHHLKTKELKREDIKLLFGITTCISESLFLKLLRNLNHRVKTMYLETSVRTGDVNSEILHFCLLHGFKRAARQLCLSHDFIPHKNDMMIAVYNFNDENLLDMMKLCNRIRTDDSKPGIFDNFIRCFTFKRNLEGLRYYRLYFHDKNLIMKISPSKIIDFSRNEYFQRHILLDRTDPATSVDIIRELQKLGVFPENLKEYRQEFLKLVPLLPEQVLLFFLTVPLSFSSVNTHMLNILDEKVKLIRGIEQSQTLDNDAKKKIVDWLFYSENMKKIMDLNFIQETFRINFYKQKKPKKTEVEETEGEDEDEEDEEDDQEQTLNRINRERLMIDDGKKVNKKYDLNFFKFKLNLRIGELLKTYHFVSFYGRQGKEAKFREALELVDLKKVRLRPFQIEGISEEFIEMGRNFGKIMLVRPADLLPYVSKKNNKEFDTRLKQFRFVKDVMQKDMDELLKICILVSNNYAFQKLINVEGYSIGLEPINFTASQNRNSVELVSYLAQNYINGKNNSSGSRTYRLGRVLSVCRENLGKYISLAVSLLRDPDFEMNSRLMVEIEDTPSMKRKYVDMFWKEYRPKKLKDLMLFLKNLVTKKRKKMIQKLFTQKYWKNSYLISLRLEKRHQLVIDFDKIMPRMKKKFKIGCFHCGKELWMMDPKIIWNNHFNQCKNCSPTFVNLNDRKLPVDTRDLERIYCNICCRNRPVQGVQGMYCIVCAN